MSNLDRNASLPQSSEFCEGLHSLWGQYSIIISVIKWYQSLQKKSLCVENDFLFRYEFAFFHYLYLLFLSCFRPVLRGSWREARVAAGQMTTKRV